MLQPPGKLQCAQLAMDFLWARERNGLEDMAAAMKAIAAVCFDWNKDMFECALKQWYCRHIHLWDCLTFMNPFARRKMTLDCPRFVLAEVRSRAFSAFKVHDRGPFAGAKTIDTDKLTMRCSLNCCRSSVGRNIALSRNPQGHISEEAYGDSDYLFAAYALPDKGNRHSRNHIPTFLRQVLGWLKTSGKIKASRSQSTTGYDLHVSWVVHAEQHHGDVEVGQIALACSKGCYKILKAITQDLTGIQGEFVLVLRGVSDDVMFSLDNDGVDWSRP